MLGDLARPAVATSRPRICAHTVLCVGCMKRASISSRVRPVVSGVSDKTTTTEFETRVREGGKRTFGLRNEEEGPDAHEHEDTAEEEVGAVAQVGDHVRSGARDDEGTEPGCGGCNGDGKHPDLEGLHFRSVEPGDALPCGADDHTYEMRQQTLRTKCEVLKVLPLMYTQTMAKYDQPSRMITPAAALAAGSAPEEANQLR